MRCQCQGIEDEFNARVARRELKRYRRRGPRKTTQLLLEEITQADDVAGASLLDIGGGVGAIQHELGKAGVKTIYSVDASSAFLETAKAEAERLELVDRVTYHHGDFVEHAEHVPSSDLVTLDRVLCCYDNVDELVKLSAARASAWYALVFPRTDWWMSIAFLLGNALLKLKRSSFRAYLHPTDYVESLVTSAGLHRASLRRTALWQVVVYRR